ncbi:MAG: GNAT superfamily N-acetyltransferase [Ilumatobacter sp.]
MSVTVIEAADTHDLRRRVLRNGDPRADLVWAHDNDPHTEHLGIRLVDESIVAISTWLQSPCPNYSSDSALQLRGMATDPAHNGQGHGSALLRAGTERAKAAGHDLIWANARVTALEFYERAGFTVSGPVFSTATTGLPHRLVVLRLERCVRQSVGCP